MFPGFTIELPFAIHLHEVFAGFTINPLSWFGIFGNILQPSIYGARGFFIVCVIFAGIIIELLMTQVIEKKKKA